MRRRMYCGDGDCAVLRGLYSVTKAVLFDRDCTLRQRLYSATKTVPCGGVSLPAASARLDGAIVSSCIS